MKILRFCTVMLFFSLFLVQAGYSQNKKLDKALRKTDKHYEAGNFSKALNGLKKFKKNAAKISGPNSYMLAYHIREARFNTASGMLAGFENSISNAINTSQAVYGETGEGYAETMLDVAELYIDFGNYRIARDYTEQSESLLTKTEQMNDTLASRIALIKAEAMIGQGFANDAIEVLLGMEKYFASRAVDRETRVEDGKIKSVRLDEADVFKRHNDYARFKTLLGLAYGRKGRISIIGKDAANPDIDMIYGELESWIRSKRRFLGRISLADVRYRYLWDKSLEENGMHKALKYQKTLDDLKKITEPTNELAHQIYLSYIAYLQDQGNRPRYLNTKLEYEKMIGKNYPKTSLHRINLHAVDFSSKLARDKTRNLENNAVNVLASENLPKFHRTRGRILEFLYQVAITERRYGNAEAYLTQLSEIKKELCGESSPEYHLSKLALANFYLDYTNKIEEAGKIYQESFIDFVSKEIDVQHKDLFGILTHLAQYYEMADNYTLASTILDQAESSVRAKFDPEDILYGIGLTNVAKLQIQLGDYDDASTNIDKALQVIGIKKNRDYVEYSPAYIDALETQARIYGIKGLFDEAESNLSKTRREISRTDVPIDEFSTAQELSTLYIQLGKYTETDKLLNKLLPEYQRLFGQLSLRLIQPLVNKGRILLAKGDYTEADRVARRAHEIALNIYGESSTKTAATQQLLGDINYTLGDYEKAEDNLTKAIATLEKQFGRQHIETAKTVSQLALIKFHKGDNRKEVEKLMLEARDIMADKLGKDNPQYAEILKNVAVLYISEGRYDIAFNSLTVAESIWRAKTGTKNNINAASIYTLTGDVYYQLKNYSKAEEFYNKSKKLYEDFFSNTHPEYVKVLSKLSKVYYMVKNYKQSKRLIDQALANYEEYIKKFFPALSEREKAKYWNTIKGDFEFYNTLAFSNLDDFKDLTGRIYNAQLMTKALLLSNSIKMRERILNSTDEPLKEQYNEWIQKKELLTIALSMSPAQLTENEIDPVALTQSVELLERELSQKSELFSQNFEDKRIVFEDVKNSLGANEVAVELVRYRHFNHTFTDSVIYAALYLTPKLNKPKAIVMEDGRNMETRYFRYYRNSIIGRVPDQYSYNVYWKPIVDEIGQTATIYLSADGVYNQINLEAIPSPEGRYVIDNSNIVLVSNTKDIYLRKVKSRSSATENTASVFGNPTFYLTASANSRKEIQALPGTEKEVQQLQNILAEKGWNTNEYVEALAAEENIKELNNPRVLHIATHGLYKPAEEVTLSKQIEGAEALLAQNPLMRSGLLLKGAGDILAKTDFNYNMENGILTAQEAMSLNLDKTDFVVLSACETGLGDLEWGEGVYGLQRAFLTAGAKVLIMSMFKVDDVATQKLMSKFYLKWSNTNNLRESFIDAKKELRVDYPDPIFWGAFMMIGLE